MNRLWCHKPHPKKSGVVCDLYLDHKSEEHKSKHLQESWKDDPSPSDILGEGASGTYHFSQVDVTQEDADIFRRALAARAKELGSDKFEYEMDFNHRNEIRWRVVV